MPDGRCGWSTAPRPTPPRLASMLSDADLLRLPLEDLTALAHVVRDGAHGRRVTFSPKVFIPLTMLCRDKCGYCTFAKAPARVTAPYLLPEEVLAIAEAGKAAGCHEALFTLGERPELRYPVAAEWLAGQGYASTVDYLAAMCRLVLEETGLLPHANAGALDATELAALRPVAASQGMMLESLAEGLDAHRGSPDKEPARRLATLEFAGELAIPFTTGILVGIGDTPDRSAGRPARHRRVARPPRARAGGHCAELPAQAGHGHVPGRALPPRGPAVGHCGGPPGPAARDPRAGAPEPLRPAGPAARRRHRRLGRRVARHGRPREPRAGLAGARHPARGDRGGRPHAGAPPHRVSQLRPRPGALARPGAALPGAGRLRRRGAGPRHVVVLGG